MKNLNHAISTRRKDRCPCSNCEKTGLDGPSCASCGCVRNSHWSGMATGDKELWHRCHSCGQDCKFILAEKAKIQ